MASAPVHPKATRTLAATLYAQGVRPGEIASRLGVPRNTLNTWTKRLGWTHAKSIATQEHLVALEKVVSHESEKIRSRLATELSTQVETLATIKPRKHLKDLRARADVTEAIARTASRVHGWDQSSNAGNTVVSLSLSNLDPVLDVEQVSDAAAPPEPTSTPSE